MNRMSLAHLRVFCEVADCLSVTQAANRLYRTQPAISRQLAELEKSLGVALFLRHGRKLELTGEGKELHVRSRALLSDADDLVERAQELAAGNPSVLRIGVTSTSLEDFIPAAVFAFRRDWPDVIIRIVEADAPDLASLVETGQLDLAFMRDLSSDSLSSTRLFPLHLVAIVPPLHRLAERKSLEVQDLEREPLLLTNPGTGSRVLLARACQAEGLTLRDVRIESRAYSALLALAEGGYGIAVVLSIATIARPRAAVLPVFHGGEQLGTWFSAIWHNRRTASTHADAFVMTVRKLFEKQYPGKDYGFTKRPE